MGKVRSYVCITNIKMAADEGRRGKGMEYENERG